MMMQEGVMRYGYKTMREDEMFDPPARSPPWNLSGPPASSLVILQD